MRYGGIGVSELPGAGVVASLARTIGRARRHAGTPAFRSPECAREGVPAP